jgi:hypothetical protein
LSKGENVNALQVESPEELLLLLDMKIMSRSFSSHSFDALVQLYSRLNRDEKVKKSKKSPKIKKKYSQKYSQKFPKI